MDLLHEHGAIWAEEGGSAWFVSLKVIYFGGKGG